MRRSSKAPRVTAGLKWPPDTYPAAWIAASNPRPNPNGTTIRMEASIARAAATDIEPTKTRMNVPRSSARYFRAFIRTSDSRRRTTSSEYADWETSPDERRARCSPGSGGRGEGLRVASDVDRDPTIRALERRRVEAVDNDLAVTPGAFDADHGRSIAALRDS